jgi:hypothetical protein
MHFYKFMFIKESLREKNRLFGAIIIIFQNKLKIIIHMKKIFWEKGHAIIM